MITDIVSTNAPLEIKTIGEMRNIIPTFMFEASGDDGDLAKEMGKERYKSLSEGDLDMVVIWRRSELLVI